MAFNVRFYSMGKEVNSTAIPANDGTLVSCVANGRLDMIRPSIKLQRGLGGGSDSPRTWNYCYIQPFNRFYFVQNWSYEGGLWYAECEVDVLGTYRSEIGELNAYVLRSAAAFDGTISDGMYPAKNSYTFDSVSIDNPWVWDLFFGTIVVGIAGTGNTYYYKFTYVNFTNFIKNLMSDTYASSVVGTLGLTLNSEAKAICDPIQYITSVIFIPVQDWNGMEERTITVGFGTVTANCSLVTSTGAVTTRTHQITNIPKHASSASRGEYLNHAPWTRYVLDIPPFGAMELDPDKLSNSTVNITFTIDWCTGNAVMRVFGNTNAQIALVKGSIGVPIEVGQVLKPGYGALSVIQGVAGIASSVAGGFIPSANGSPGASSKVGGILSGIGGSASMIKDAIESQIPSLNTVGSVGSYADLVGRPTVYAQFTAPANESNSTRGRPLCRTAKLSTLPGYMIVADPDITGMIATGQEKDMIMRFLTGGFYYA